MFVDKITINIENFHFNKVIANIHELTNYVQKELDKKQIGKEDLIKFIDIYAKLIHPVIPHISEEIWKLFNNKGLVVNQPWPTNQYKNMEDSNLKIKIALQINGKTRMILEIKKDLDKDKVSKLAFENTKIIKYLSNKKPKKIIFVPNKIMNIVV